MLEVNVTSYTTPLLLYFVLCAPLNYHCFRLFGAVAFLTSYVALLLLKCIVFLVTLGLCVLTDYENSSAKNFHVQ